MKLKSLTSSLTLVAALAATSAFAGLDGSTVTVNLWWPVVGASTAVAGPNVVDNTVEFPGFPSGLFDIQVTNDQIIETANIYGYSLVDPFNGFDFVFSGANTITGVTQDSSSDFLAKSISFSPNSVALNFSGAVYVPGHKSVFDITTTPSPAAILPFLGGLAAIGRRRKSA